MKFFSNPKLAAISIDTATVAGELQFNSTTGKFGGSDGVTLGEFATEQILASIINGEGASLVSIEDLAGNYVAIDLESLTIEIDGRLKSLEQFKEVLNNVDFNINYLKATTGAPVADVALLDGEICLNTADNVYYTALSGAWDAGQSFLLKRGIFKDSGAAVIGGLTSGATQDIYDGASVSTPYIPNFANMVAVASENIPNGKLYFFNNTSWVFAANLSAHNDLNGIQGGTTNEYFHLTSAERSLVAALGSNTSNEGASLVSVESGSLNGSVTNIQTALNLLYASGAKKEVFAARSYAQQGTEIYTHTANTRNIQVVVQLDAGGFPGEIIELESIAISNTQFTVETKKSGLFHVTLLA